MSENLTSIIPIPYDAEAIFKTRPNRYLGIVDIISPEIQHNVPVHIHDPGRLKELLYPENQILLRSVPGSHRKTQWDVLAAHYDTQWVLIHSGYHRSIAEQILKNPVLSPYPTIRKCVAEVPLNDSRLDFLLELQNAKQVWVEVKGCTLAQNRVALFPDAPTKRGAKHLKTLIETKANGFEAAVLILIFRTDVDCFMPNQVTDPDFSFLFNQAIKMGVEVHPYILSYSNNNIYFNRKTSVCPV
ncbi:DNA/RNA nuclease SfsA [candidate division KSB1 bacterium]|nr:DNA/RNA nuclease SfsA [candidate division KSB1 bacterium]